MLMTYNTQTTAGLVPFTELMMPLNLLKLLATDEEDTNSLLYRFFRMKRRSSMGVLPRAQRFKMSVQ